MKKLNIKKGDLVTNTLHLGYPPTFGVVTKHPDETNNGDYEVWFTTGVYTRKVFCSPRHLELVSENR